MATTRGGKRRSKVPRSMPMAALSADRRFTDICQLYDIPMTRRQLSKWRNGYGIAALHAGRNTRPQPQSAR